MITWLIGVVIAGAVGLVFLILEYWDFGGSSSGRASDDSTATGDGGTDWFWGDADSSDSDSSDSGGAAGGGDGGGGD